MMRARSLLMIAALAVAGAWRIADVTAPPAVPPVGLRTVDDVTRSNAVDVSAVYTPTSTDEIARIVSSARMISVGGARHSMGGQIAAPGSVHLDLRRFNRILRFSPEARTITVQGGTTWRQIQTHIDPHDLAVAVMQSFANFTVGGSLSVNVHGRYVGAGPVIRTVLAMRMVLADGSIVDTGPDRRTEIFSAAIGGYGGIGVIAEVTLRLDENAPLERRTALMPVTDYERHFLTSVRTDDAAVMHSADLYPPAFDTVRTVTFFRTSRPLTDDTRLAPFPGGSRIDRLALWAASEWPFGSWLRRRLVDPWRFRGRPVLWRNYEASTDADRLEPASRAVDTYLLQEYFVPVGQVNTFAAALRGVVNTHQVNVVYVSIRHSPMDRGSMLAWSRDEVFAFVIYYKRANTQRAKEYDRTWTRELVQAALAVGGTYYLPYEVHATREQFLRGYPRALEFFAVKRELDPTSKFQNALWNAYAPADELPAPP